MQVLRRVASGLLTVLGAFGVLLIIYLLVLIALPLVLAESLRRTESATVREAVG